VYAVHGLGGSPAQQAQRGVMLSARPMHRSPV